MGRGHGRFRKATFRAFNALKVAFLNSGARGRTTPLVVGVRTG
jgi:hypothetical protein